jgi:gamma-glutamyltranspeptidase/glutathione hydrolase
MVWKSRALAWLAVRAVAACAALAVALPVAAANRPDEAQVATAAHAMVVTQNPLASRAGLEVLKAGGNAADAAVTTALALAVVHPQAGNLGGGGFLLYYRRATASAR